LKYNATSLTKLEKLISESSYILRHERGNFQTGFCILEQKKVLVINKFLSTEGKINTLLEIIPLLNIEEQWLSAESKKTFQEAMNNAANLAVAN
jgi:hypothetical protein